MEGQPKLWKAEEQAARVAELIADESPLKETPLRRDVRSLGWLLGEVLKEQGGEELFSTVEELRTWAIRHREEHARASQPTDDLEGERHLMQLAQDKIAGLSIDKAYHVTKAFAVYFELTNLAETNHRKRRRRASHFHPEKPPQPGSFRGTLLRMRGAGVEPDQLLRWLEQLSIVPVFTAHPTEVARRTVLLKRQEIARELEALDRVPLADSEVERRQRSIAAKITALWQTDEVRRRKPKVQDEIRMILDYFDKTLIDSVPSLYETLTLDLNEVYGIHTRLPALFHFGSWVGGDRDGNPNVHPDSTGTALTLGRRLILTDYLRRTNDLRRRLSLSSVQVPASSSLKEALGD